MTAAVDHIEMETGVTKDFVFESLAEIHAEAARFAYDVVQLVDAGAELVPLCDAADDILWRIQMRRDELP